MVLKSSTQFGNVLPKAYRITIEKALRLSIGGLGRGFLSLSLFFSLSVFVSQTKGSKWQNRPEGETELNIFSECYSGKAASATAANNIEVVW